MPVKVIEVTPSKRQLSGQYSGDSDNNRDDHYRPEQEEDDEANNGYEEDMTKTDKNNRHSTK